MLAQLDTLIDRITRTRNVRVLVVDDDTARARYLVSLARRAHPAAVVETSSEGTDAAHKLNRDHPDLVFIDADLKGVMNALELCMYTRGLEVAQQPQLVLIGEIADRERAIFASANAHILPADAGLADSVLNRVRASAAEPVRRRKRTTIVG